MLNFLFTRCPKFHRTIYDFAKTEPSYFGPSIFSDKQHYHSPRNAHLVLPDLTLQLNEISSPTRNVKKTYSKQKVYLETTEKFVIRPNSQELLNCKLTNDELPIETNAIVEPLPNFERKTCLCNQYYWPFWRRGPNADRIFELSVECNHSP